MTDFNRYKNISVNLEAYKKADDLQNKITAVKLSKTQVFTLGINLLESLITNNKQSFNDIQKRLSANG